MLPKPLCFEKSSWCTAEIQC